ncbi:hypothetical protein Nepgr_014832 [Nepenthes gracilis]|uniref:Uncharacterized protein n=1 Tax=Nepenthes gracilis TaxID=150966 RepID=A0AAD3XQQ9_NEPGR|nr:hypothetical protein Nepgr_014832 [Nepenthes gracilis]
MGSIAEMVGFWVGSLSADISAVWCSGIVMVFVCCDDVDVIPLTLSYSVELLSCLLSFEGLPFCWCIATSDGPQLLLVCNKAGAPSQLCLLYRPLVYASNSYGYELELWLLIVSEFAVKSSF